MTLWNVSRKIVDTLRQYIMDLCPLFRLMSQLLENPMYHELVLLQASDACHFFTSGQAKIQQCLLREGHDLITEALNLLNNVYGAMHPDISSCLRLLARINYILGDYPEVQLSYHYIRNFNFLLLPVLIVSPVKLSGT